MSKCSFESGSLIDDALSVKRDKSIEEYQQADAVRNLFCNFLNNCSPEAVAHEHDIGKLPGLDIVHNGGDNLFMGHIGIIQSAMTGVFRSISPAILGDVRLKDIFAIPALLSVDSACIPAKQLVDSTALR